MSKKKQLTKKQETEAAAYQEEGAWGEGPELSAQDMVIPKILPMQGLSKLVAERKAQLGEFRDSVNAELLGSIDEPMKFIPFKIDKLWVKTLTKGGKTSFEGIEPITRENESAPKEEQLPSGDFLHRDYTYYVYCVLPRDVEEGSMVPYILSFKRTSVKAGKKVMTQMYVRNKMAGKSPAAYVMELNGRLASNDKGTFVVLDVDTAKEPATAEQQNFALEVFKLINQGEAKIDDSDIEDSKPSSNYARENMEF